MDNYGPDMPLGGMPGNSTLRDALGYFQNIYERHKSNLQPHISAMYTFLQETYRINRAIYEPIIRHKAEYVSDKLTRLKDNAISNLGLADRVLLFEKIK